MKVAIIMPLGEQRGGGELALLDLILNGRNSNLKWLLIFQQEGSLVEQIRNLGVEVRVVPSGRLREPHKMIGSVFKIASIVKQEKVDVILSWMWKAHLYGCPAAILAGVPSLWSQLEAPDDYWLKRLVTYLPTNGIFINSESGKAILQQLRPDKPIQMVYPGVALDRFNPSQLPSLTNIRQKLNLPVNVPVIGIVGRLQKWKGMHVLIKAMPKILVDHPDAKCLIVGGKHDLEPNYEDYLREQVKHLKLNDQVIFVGQQQNIPEWMQSMDVVVHASDNEPFGIVVVEAMALGKPVIAANSGGPTEIMTDGVDGLLTPYGDETSLAKAVVEYLDNEDFARKVGIAAQQRSLDFSTIRYAENFIKGIRELMVI
jgi:glycosyltransferase involved in cell wall biosynthesis